MAQKRMLDKSIVDSDQFLDMPLSTQALYFHLNMRADDEGFINNPKRVMKMVGTNDDDLKILVAKAFVIPFESGVVVIRHWKINNYLRADRVKPTTCIDERRKLVEDKGVYDLGIPDVNQMTAVGLPSREESSREESSVVGKKIYIKLLDPLTKENIKKVKLTKEQYEKLKERYEDKLDDTVHLKERSIVIIQ